MTSQHTKPSPMNAAELQAFNEQFAQLAAANLPVEYGLRLIAEDLQRGKMSEQMHALADDLDRGVPLGQAFARRSSEFPPLYTQLIEAGVRSSNLAGMLMNLGRHLELMRRLRAAMWRTFAYPIAVIVFLGIVLTLFGYLLLPQFAVIYEQFDKVHFRASVRSDQPVEPPTFPWITSVLYDVGRVAPLLLLLGAIVLVLGPWMLRRWSRTNANTERFVLRLPFIGPILKGSLIARWCDATAMAVSAGMDLPGAMRLASEAIHSPALLDDGNRLARQAEAGQLGAGAAEFGVLPATVPMAMQVASQSSDLPATLHSLTDLYERQANLRLENLPAMLSPILLAIMATLIGFTVLALILPLVQVINYYMKIFM